MANGKQITVYDDNGKVRRVSRAAAEAMGWSASPPLMARSGGSRTCDFCGTPLEPGATVGTQECPRCQTRAIKGY